MPAIAGLTGTRLGVPLAGSPRRPAVRGPRCRRSAVSGRGGGGLGLCNTVLYLGLMLLFYTLHRPGIHSESAAGAAIGGTGLIAGGGRGAAVGGADRNAGHTRHPE